MAGSILLRDRTCTVAAVSALLIHVSELSGGRADTVTMCPVSRRAFLGSCLGTAGLLLAGPARAQHDDDDDFGHHHDHDRARHAVERGEAQPLSDILAQVGPDLGGEVVGVAFRRQAGRWLYEFRVIAPTGQMTEVYVDAATVRIMQREPH
jgi:uncharacterized membrane protein YkoI